MKYSTQQYIDVYNGGNDIDFLFFWGHQPRKDGSIGKSCLSQWWPAPFTIENITYQSAEHYMMAEKARLFGDEEIRIQIIESTSPKKAKALGRKVRNFDNDTWLKHRNEIVVSANLFKFDQNPQLREFLLSTSDKILVEASPVDFIWGIGLAENDADALNPNKWKGDNLLGFILMEIRDQL